MELSKYKLSDFAENGCEFEITHPDTGEGLDGWITVRGERSKIVEAYTRKRINEQLKVDAINARKGNKNEKVKVVEDLIEDLNESAAIRVMSWKNIKKNGVEIPFSKESAIELFTEYDWIRSQVLEVSGSSDRFS